MMAVKHISMIYARSKTGIIGRRDGSLPVKCRDDMTFFKEKTMGSTLIVGRKTYEGLPPLSGRSIIVLSKSVTSAPSRACPSLVAIIDNVEDALSKAREIGRDVYIAGGREVYETFAGMGVIETVYETIYDDGVEEADGDVKYSYTPLSEDGKGLVVKDTLYLNGCHVNVWR